MAHRSLPPTSTCFLAFPTFYKGYVLAHEEYSINRPLESSSSFLCMQKLPPFDQDNSGGDEFNDGSDTRSAQPHHQKFLKPWMDTPPKLAVQERPTGKSAR